MVSYIPHPIHTEAAKVIQRILPILTLLVAFAAIAVGGLMQYAAREGIGGQQNDAAEPDFEIAVGDSPELTQARLNESIELCAQYLRNARLPNGQFVYRINLDPDVRVTPKYNMLRHAGTIYALASYHQKHPSAETQKVISKAVDFLNSQIEPVPGNDGALTVWSRPEINGSDSPLQAKLGGTGLALVALLSAHEAGAVPADIEHLRGLGRFLEFMQKPDGSFYSKFIPSEGGRDDSWTSLYYPGEAALGLTMLYEKDPQPRWLRAAVEAVSYLARSRKGRLFVEIDHWALLATERLMALDDPSIPRELLLEHAVQICRSTLMTAVPPSEFRHWGLRPDGSVCSTATRLEGLQAALQVLPEDEPLRPNIERAIEESTRFMVNSQVREGKFAGGIPRAARRLPEEHPLASDSFNERAMEIRIDYVQHVLSALLVYQDSSR
jgi:hypothetical protein